MATLRQAAENRLSGKGREHIPNIAFHGMSVIMKLMDLFGKQSERNFASLGIREGEIVVDYGCGPARYVVNASKAVGTAGRVYAVDIHPLAIQKVKAKIKRHSLANVKPILAQGYRCGIDDHGVDLIYALDMFHMISKPDDLLKEFARMIRPDGRVIIEDGHQPRSETISKISRCRQFSIVDENRRHVVCKVGG